MCVLYSWFMQYGVLFTAGPFQSSGPQLVRPKKKSCVSGLIQNKFEGRTVGTRKIILLIFLYYFFFKRCF